jgi:flagellin-specific chaperone FliS
MFLICYAAPMQISEESLQKFIQIHEREYGETISREEAHGMASRLLGLYTHILFETDLWKIKSSDPETGEPKA